MSRFPHLLCNIAPRPNGGCVTVLLPCGLAHLTATAQALAVQSTAFMSLNALAGFSSDYRRQKEWVRTTLTSALVTVL